MNLWLEMQAQLQHLLTQGGILLWAILATALVIFVMSMERFLYLVFTFPRELAVWQAGWESRQDKQSWSAYHIREALQAQATLFLHRYLWLLKTCIVVCPLLGLTGTVTGMILVFENLSFTGTGNPRLMSAGIFKATIPTMAGMLVAIIGMILQQFILRLAKQRQHQLDQALVIRKQGATV